MDTKQTFQYAESDSAHKNRVLDAAKKHCEARGAKLTPIRRLVLSLLLDYPDVVKAYDVLNDLQQIKQNAAPPTVYRALDFLVEMDILHRAESLNGYVFCPHFHQAHQSVILSCNQCGKVTELAANEQIDALVAYCQQHEFSVAETPLVLNGVCQHCQRNSTQVTP